MLNFDMVWLSYQVDVFLVHLIANKNNNDDLL